MSLSPAQLFSKACIGNANLLFNRGYAFNSEQAYELIPLFKEQKVTDVIISGDLTTTASHSEFKLARAYVDRLEKEGFRVYLIPGNHDHYTKKAFRQKRFYDYFQESYTADSSYSLSKHGITAKQVETGFWLILLDTALATSLPSANGLFSKKHESHLTSLLQTIPKNDRILCVNHFPFSQHETPRRRLLRGESLEKMLRSFPQAKLYLHGHTHRRCVADLRANGLPIVLDSGSTSFKNGSFNLIDLEKETCALVVYTAHQGKWKEEDHHLFRWNHE